MVKNKPIVVSATSLLLGSVVAYERMLKVVAADPRIHDSSFLSINT